MSVIFHYTLNNLYLLRIQHLSIGLVINWLIDCFPNSMDIKDTPPEHLSSPPVISELQSLMCFVMFGPLYLSARLLFMASDYPFGIFKLYWSISGRVQVVFDESKYNVYRNKCLWYPLSLGSNLSIKNITKHIKDWSSLITGGELRCSGGVCISWSTMWHNRKWPLTDYHICIIVPVLSC
jgi:hypothetical protein